MTKYMERNKILVVDDEEDLCEILQFNLESEGFAVDIANSAEEALKLLTDEHELILLDVMMEGMSGFKMAEKVRKEMHMNTPIIFLTAKDTENDMLTGFSIGGDDYIAKPFSIKELAARVSLSSTPVFERLKRLESNGYIKKYIAVLDAEKLNQGFVVFCSVRLTRLNKDIASEFTRIIQDIPEVTECYNISGDYDYLLKIHAPNMKHYQEFILNVLGTIDSLGSLRSTFVMDEVKHEYGIHI